MFAVTPPGAGEPSAALRRWRAVPHRPAGAGRRAAARLEAAASPRWVLVVGRVGGHRLGGRRGAGRARLDVAEAHRLLHGGWSADRRPVLAAAYGIPVDEVPAPRPATCSSSHRTPHPSGRLAGGRRRAPARRPRGVAARPGPPTRLGAGRPRYREPAARRRRGRLCSPGGHGAVRVCSRRAVPGAAPRRAADRPAAHRAAAGRRGRPPARDRGRGAGDPPRPRRTGAAACARPGVDRPAQPGAGARAAQGGGGRRAEHPQVGARALPNRAPRGGRAARLAPRRAHRHDVRLPTGSTHTWGPTTGSVGGGPPATGPPAG